MKNKHLFRLLSAVMLVCLVFTNFTTTAFAYAEPEDDPTQATEPVPEETTEQTELDMDTLLSALAGAGITISVTEDGIQFTTAGEETATVQVGTVTTNGGRLNVRTGAGLNNSAFTQLPNGTTVEVIGVEGDWIKILLPEREGYVYADYLTITDAEDEDAVEGSFSISISAEELSSLLALFSGSDASTALTPDGNLTLIDDIGSTTGSGKQFITVESKNGNVFYLIIDRDDEGVETVHFLNQVDEADLLALMDEEDTAEIVAVCSCSEKCAAGTVNASCSVCATNMTECTGKEPVATEPTEPEEPTEGSGSSTGALLAVVLILAIGGGAAYYFLVMKPKQGKKVPSDLDDFDLEDEEYIDEETEDVE